ncbi:CoA transferase subunit A [Chloroflexota bacterium]
MFNKIYKTTIEALADIKDGATIMLGGFAGGQGAPYNLIDSLIERGVKNLTVIANNHLPINDLAREKQVKKALICFEGPATYDPRYRFLEDAHRNGEVEVEVMGFGVLTWRIQAWGSGVAGFYTRVGVDTLLAKGKEERIFDGEKYIFERALGADFALIKAYKSDTKGNLLYRKAARNINPTMAMGANTVIVEVDDIVEVGELDPETIVTPSIFVDRIVKAKTKRTVIKLKS